MTDDARQLDRAIAEDFLESSAAAFAAPYLRGVVRLESSGDAAGVVVGRYRLVREIGHGGMGWVWEAERADGQYEQRVALKLLRRGVDSADDIARFRRERQILARLEHPNIARLLDGGVTDDGRPYFVMEQVPGTPITAHSAARALGTAERLHLFRVVCRAVEHAHRNLVVHRDIKPSNVLVSETGDVKLLDFGVANLLDEPGEPGVAMRTPHTPGYASPEQLAGAAAATTSDVYQLGVLLHEQLTGKRPGAGASPPRGDLASIIARCLQPDPGDRYSSVEALADDIDRYLAHRPLQHGGTWWYRTARFARRNRLRLAAGTLVLAAVTVFATAYVVQIRVERDRARNEASKTSEDAALLYRFFLDWNVDAADRGHVSAEKVLNDAAVGAARELQAQPETLASALSMLGDLQTALGQTAAADTLLGAALAIQERPGAAVSTDLATTLVRRGKLLLRIGRDAEAETMLRRGIAAFDALAMADHKAVMLARDELAKALSAQMKLTEAERLLRDLTRDTRGDAPFASEVAADLGYVLFLEARYTEAATLLRTTLDEQRRIFGRMHHSTLVTTRSLASSLRDRASLPEAEALDREALAISRTLYGDTHLETFYSMSALAVLLERKGDFAASEGIARAAVDLAIRLSGEQTVRTALILRTLGGILLAQGRSGEAESALRRALAAFESAAPQGHPDEADVLNRLAFVTLRRHATDASAIYDRAVRFRARPASEPIFVTDGYEYLAWSAHEMGDLPLADTLFRRAATLYDGELPDGHLYRVQTARWMAEVR